MPVFSVKKHFMYILLIGNKYSITWELLPMISVYTYINYKSQGHSLGHVIVYLAGYKSL